MPPSSSKTVAKEVPYPTVRSIAFTGADAIGIDKMKEMLGWEDEESYKKRVGSASGGKGVGFGEEYLLKDAAGQKIRCHHNSKNRPLDTPWADALAQDILHSGPLLSIEKRRWQFNGEPIILSREGDFLSGQHRGLALIFAVLEYRKNPVYWKEHGGWNVEPKLETVVVVGIDGSQRTTRTLDNVKPRSLADVFYTSDLFARKNPKQKQEMSKYLQGAVNLLWKRTGVGDSDSLKYQTHAESVDLFDRHPSLLKCVDHIYSLNSGDLGKRILELNLSAGMSAGIMYLMGASATDAEEYWSGPYARREKCISWDRMDDAKTLWTDFANTEKKFTPLVDALADLKDEDLGAGGRVIEKTGVIAKAWQYETEGAEYGREDLRLLYSKDQTTGKNILSVGKDFPSFGGIDQGEKAKSVRKADPTPKELAERSKAEKTKTLAESRDNHKPETKKPSAQAESNDKTIADTFRKELTKIREKHAGKVIAFETKDGHWTFWGTDAKFAADRLSLEPISFGGLERLEIKFENVPDVKKRLLLAKVKLATCVRKDGIPVVSDVIR